MNSDWKIYNNILEFIKFRGYKLETEKADKEQFKEQVLKEGYFRVPCSEKEKKFILDIYSRDTETANSPYNKSSFETIIKKIKKENNPHAYIMILKEEPRKSIQELYQDKEFTRGIDIKWYLNKNFLLIPFKAAHSGVHSIVEDENKVLNELLCDKENLPLIKVSDPNCVWLGAEPGNIIKIITNSVITGERINYRVVE